MNSTGGGGCRRRPSNAQDDAADARFYPVGELPPLAFDHTLVVRRALRRLAELPEAADGARADGWGLERGGEGDLQGGGRG